MVCTPDCTSTVICFYNLHSLNQALNHDDRIPGRRSIEGGGREITRGRLGDHVGAELYSGRQEVFDLLRSSRMELWLSWCSKFCYKKRATRVSQVDGLIVVQHEVCKNALLTQMRMGISCYVSLYA